MATTTRLKARTVSAAFTEFLREMVNLDPSDSAKARNSRDWLLTQIHGFPDKHSDFPLLYTARDIAFGSFARKTKIRELDDVDLISCLSGDGSYYTEYGDELRITVPNALSRLRGLCFDGSTTLNSRKVINRFVRALNDVPQYENAASRNGEAAVLELKSYPWNFDAVPGFFTAPTIFGRTYYVIPNGQGHWKKTDPRLDRDRVSRVNQAHDQNVLNVIRALKYWNRRPTMPSVGSYLLECMLVDHYEARSEKALTIQWEVYKALEHVRSAVNLPVQDPKGIQGDINNLDLLERLKISKRAEQDSNKALAALVHEVNGEPEKAINLWAEVFGSEFPTYG